MKSEKLAALIQHSLRALTPDASLNARQLRTFGGSEASFKDCRYCLFLCGPVSSTGTGHLVPVLDTGSLKNYRYRQS